MSPDVCEMCRRVFMLCCVALSPSRRLLENSTFLDLYERASLKYDTAERRFTPA